MSNSDTLEGLFDHQHLFIIVDPENGPRLKNRRKNLIKMRRLSAMLKDSRFNMVTEGR